jgi:ABC-type dipeptide/oligopeptide/nickel transport system ATPase subunit
MKNFREELKKNILHFDQNGIYSGKDQKECIANFSCLEYQYSIKNVETGCLTRRIQIGTTTFDIEAKHLLNKNNFNTMLLSRSSYHFTGSTQYFRLFIQILLSLENNLVVKNLPGFGRVRKDFWNLGNIVYTEDTVYPWRELVWSGPEGYFLQKINMINVNTTGITPAVIFDKFTEIFGEYSMIVLGFAVSGMYFSEIMKQISSFPILYLTGSAGIGKSTFSELFLKLYGVERSWGTVNCDSNSTKIGIDEKTQEFNNIPLILNEIGKSYYPMLKSRYDIQGSVKASQLKNKKTAERNVKGSTVAISVYLPEDPQVSSRFIIIDYEKVQRNKTAFDELHKESSQLTRFILDVIRKISVKDIISNTEQFKNTFAGVGIESRVLDNYSVVAGGMMALIKAFPDISLTSENIYKYLHSEMKVAEQLSYPLFPLIKKMKDVISGNDTSSYALYDDKYFYVNLPGFREELPLDFKNKYYHKKKDKDILEMFKKSEYPVRYGVQFKYKNIKHKGKQVLSYGKKINGTNHRCIVLSKEKILNHFTTQ